MKQKKQHYNWLIQIEQKHNHVHLYQEIISYFYKNKCPVRSYENLGFTKLYKKKSKQVNVLILKITALCPPSNVESIIHHFKLKNEVLNCSVVKKV